MVWVVRRESSRRASGCGSPPRVRAVARATSMISGRGSTESTCQAEAEGTRSGDGAGPPRSTMTSP
jgi:hypothetical protein